MKRTRDLVALIVLLACTVAISQAAPRRTATHRAPSKSAASAPAQGIAQAPVAPARRDPFVNPIEALREGKHGPCEGGKRCLAVNEIVLRGVVKTVNGMIAVVENAAQRTYFLHENDPIYNGYVKKITQDSVVFHERVTDNIGRQTEHDVVKTVNAPVV